MPASAAGGVLETLNVKIGGTFSSPKITLGVKEAAEEAIKNVVDQQIQKLTGSESLAEEVDKQKENLRAEIDKQAENLREEARKAGEKLVSARRASATNWWKKPPRRALWPSWLPGRRATSSFPKRRSRPPISPPRPKSRSSDSTRNFPPTSSLYYIV